MKLKNNKQRYQKRNYNMSQIVLKTRNSKKLLYKIRTIIIINS